MAKEKAISSGLVDLEKELTCSICTELLYQPLTLLDCLHTFCGSCLKSWFSWQASNPPESSRRPQLTCPACRALVRNTRHDAKVNTLLDLFLQSNPTKAKSSSEKEDIAKEYKHGDSVLPASNRESQTNDNEEDDRRLMAEVREMSLRDVEERNRNLSSGGSRSRGRPSRNPDERARDQRLEDARRRRRAERHMNLAPQMRDPRDPSPQSRRVEHQSSLRSLLGSAGNSESFVIEEEILRQIAEEGLLDGVDLHSLTPSQEDELTERIAQAFRRRHMEQSTARSQEQNHSQRNQTQREQTPQSSSSSAAGRSSGPDRRPARTHLLDPNPNSGSNHRRSASDQGTRRRRLSPPPTNGPSASSDALTGQTARPADDPLPRRRSSQNSLPPLSLRHRTESVPSPRQSRISNERQRRSGSRTVDRSSSERQSTESPTSTGASAVGRAQSARSHIQNAVTRPSNTAPLTPPSVQARSNQQSILPNSQIPPSQPELPIFPEPSVSCQSCRKQNIQYELHKYCPKCNDGDYNLCLRCFRSGRGCLHWFGFGDSAQYFYEKKFAQSTQLPQTREPPHVLHSRKYLRPPDETIRTPATQGGESLTTSDPSKRLQSGMFCDMCQSFADDCFWRCGDCNDGEWGFCNRCVNQGKCCTHSLLPIARASHSSPEQPLSPALNGSPLKASTSPTFGSNMPVFTEGHRALTFSTKCNICKYPIPPSTTRFHCPECNDGDYDICTNCYLKVGASGRLSKDNGRNGWRRCLQGHRMIVVGFEDHEDGQRRVVVKGLVGGHAMKDDYEPSSPTSPNSPSTVAAANISTPVSNSESNFTIQPPIRRDSGRWTWSETNNSNPDAASLAQRRRLNRSRHHMAAGKGSPDTTPTSATSSTSTKFPPPPRFPPSGGIGLRLAANWSYYPEPEDTDEIMFPRGAEITEAENINDDWLWGCYAGQTGILPGGYVIAIEQIGLETSY